MLSEAFGKMFVNQMRNGNTLTQCTIAKQPRVTTVAGPQIISFRRIKRKRGAKTAAQARIQRFSTPFDEVVNENGKKSANTSLKIFIQKAQTRTRK